jgi:hypothetical protein
MQSTNFFTLCVALTPTLAACLDSTPYVFGDAADASTVDARVPNEASEDAGPSPCLLCYQTPEDPGPGCLSDYQACMANDKCPAIFTCALDNGCLALATQEEVFNCGLPCVVQGGVASAGDPAVPIITALTTCAVGVCHPACGASP